MKQSLRLKKRELEKAITLCIDGVPLSRYRHGPGPEPSERVKEAFMPENRVTVTQEHQGKGGLLDNPVEPEEIITRRMPTSTC